MESRAPFFFLSALFYLGIPTLSFALLSWCSRKPWTGILPCVLLSFFAALFLEGAANNIFLEAHQPFLPSHTLWIGSIATLGALAIFVSVGAYVSLLIARLSPTSYVTDTPGQYFDFVSTYVWHFFEVTRLIQAGTTFGIDKPVIRPTSWLGGVPLLVFKFLTLAISFVLLAKTWTLAVDRYQAWWTN